MNYVAPRFLLAVSASRLVVLPKMTSGCRRKPASNQHRSSLAPAVTLSDLLHKAPRLRQWLTPDAQKALSATSRSFHERFIAHIKVITVTTEVDSALAMERKWLVLMMVILQRSRGCSSFLRYGLSCPQPAKVLAHIEVSTLHHQEEATIFMLRTQSSPVSDSALADQAAEQLLQQVTAKWPQLNLFRLIMSG